MFRSGGELGVCAFQDVFEIGNRKENQCRVLPSPGAFRILKSQPMVSVHKSLRAVLLTAWLMNNDTNNGTVSVFF